MNRSLIHLKTFESWVTSSTYDFDFDYNKPEKELELNQKSVIKSINKLKDSFINGTDIKTLKSQARREFGDDLYMMLELDSFFRGLKVKQKIDPQDALLYFDEYITELPRLFKNIEGDFSEYDMDDKFLKLKELKKATKKQRRISKEIFFTEKEALFVEFLKMCEWIKATNQKILITLDGRDSAGKGSFIRLIEESMPEKIVSHIWFDIPTKQEKINWFQRYTKALPTEGHLKFYDRSWYNRAVNDIVNGFCTQEEYEKFMKDVVPFEENLIDSGFIYIKMWFSIDKDIQELRFQLRQAHPYKYYKFSPNDAKAVENYPLYTFYKEKMFAETSTDKSPWVVIDMNDKKLGQLNAMRYILSKVPYLNKNKKIIKPFKTKVYEV